MTEIEDFETNDPKKLRETFEKQLAAVKAKLSEAEGRVATFESKERVRSVESALSEKGLNPKLAKFVPAEDASDPTRLDAWIKDNGELFTPVASGGGEQEESGGASSVPEGEQQAWRQIQNATGGGTQPVADMSAAVGKLKGVRNDAELMEALKAYGL